MWQKNVCIVGLGLMGGSLARALRPFLTHLTVVDNNPATLLAANALADTVTDDLAEGIRDANLVILAVPVRTILHLLTELPRLKPDGCLLLDMGSTKTDICAAMESLPESFQAVGGHPMCGKEVAGFAAAVPDLYDGQTFILCRNGRTTAVIEQVALELLALIGAQPLLLPPQRHDQLVAAISHLPYLVSTILLQQAVALADEQIWPVSASGFRDASRLAGSDPAMMLDILVTNKTAVLTRLLDYQTKLAALIDLLATDDEPGLEIFLKEMQTQHRLYRRTKESRWWQK